MMIELPSFSIPIDDLDVVLVNSQAQDILWSNHYKRHHPPDTLMIYHQACQALATKVNILSIDQYLDKVVNSSFQSNPDLVVNISGGLTSVDLTSIIPSAAAHIDAPVFPASTKGIVTTHDKLLGKYLAQNSGLKIAKTITRIESLKNMSMLIEKPICGGDSIGIRTINFNTNLKGAKLGYFIEEFVYGFDATIHLIRNDDLRSYSILEHLVSGDGREDWSDFETKNESNRLYGQQAIQLSRERHVHGISSQLLEAINRLLEVSGHPFIARIDFRQLAKFKEIGIDDCVFLELNVAPTISNANDWLEGVTNVFNGDERLNHFKALAIHPAAQSLGYLIWKFYVQSLSIARNKPDLSTNFPN